MVLQQYINSQQDQQYRKESPDIDPNTYRNTTYDKASISNQWGKDGPLDDWGQDNWQPSGGEKKDKIMYILHQKETPKIPENVNEIIAVLEKRVGELLCNLGMGKDFLTLTQNQT